MSQQTKGQRPTTVRGPALKEKMIQSQVEGEEYRSKHQGTDVVDRTTKHPSTTTTHRDSTEQSKK
jgi:hypothetical protein